jgi:hypothetical protein
MLNSIFNSTRDLAHQIERFASDIDDLLSECNPLEISELRDGLVHLESFREVAEKVNRKMLERKELERVEELAERDEYVLETVDGEELTFDAPCGFELKKQCPIYTWDLKNLQMLGDKIVAAQNFHWRRELNAEELEACNANLRLVKG